MLPTQLQRGLDNHWEAPRPIVDACADQAHAVLLAGEHHPIAVVFDLVQPIGGCGHLVRFGGE
jgi:hypothetical protein